MTPNVSGKLLENVSIFAGQDIGQLDLIAQEMTARSFRAGEMVFREGDPGDEMFIVITGAVSVFIKDNEGKEVVLTEVHGGNYFGEMSIVDQAPRSAACRVLEDTECLVFHVDDFRRIIRTMPDSAVKVMNRMLAIIVERLMQTGSFITQMVQWGEQSRSRAITDPATGLFNRRYLEESFDGLVSRAKAEGKALTFVMFDMDRFGKLNASYGQEFCDGLIVTSSKVFRRVFSKDDILVRFGGDEFIFLFPGADPETAQKKCDALCAAIADLRFPGHDELRLSCSMGFATLPHNASGTEDLKEKSDKALYQAKEQGRGRAIGWKG